MRDTAAIESINLFNFPYIFHQLVSNLKTDLNSYYM